MDPIKTVLSPIDWPSVSYEGNPLDQEVQRVGNLQVLGALQPVGGFIGAGANLPPGRVYYVDATNGNDSYDGKTWLTAFKSIQTAVNAARGGTSSDIDYTDKSQINYIYILPGHYNLTTYISVSGYNIWLIGLGTPGGDWGVTINYDRGHDATPATVVYSGSGIVLYNLFIKGAGAYPTVYCAGGDNNYILGCQLEGDSASSTYGITMTNMESSVIAGNTIWNHVTGGIYIPGGSNQYMINSKICDNLIYVATAGGKGIYVHSAATSYNTVIANNNIDVEGCGATGKGIDVDATGNVIIRDNAVVCETAATAIESAGHGKLHNHVSTNGTVTDPFDDD
jgi:hypothetical protein